MKVFKFGGASIKDAGAIKNMANILSLYKGEELVIVVSAMDKTTNRLEELCSYWHSENLDGWKSAYTKVHTFHFRILAQLMLDHHKEAFDHLSGLFSMLSELLSCKPPKSFDRAYELIVPYGELFSSSIIGNYLLYSGFPIALLDSRELITTDKTWCEAHILWDVTCNNIIESNKLRHSAGINFSLVQGFIGRSVDGYTTTLGREGSDFTASIFAYALNADEVIIWKDVPGLMNADPAIFNDAVLLESISYHEAIELAYYGAKVIHPKTIKPLQNKNIPLRVKPFFEPSSSGSLIQSLESYDQSIPSIIIKEPQALLSFSPRDFSFIAEKNLSEIFSTLSKHNIRVNMMQNSAISFSVCIDDNEEKLATISSELRDQFKVRYNRHLMLITIRHFTEDIISSFRTNVKVLLEQRSRNTIQMIVKKQ